MKGICIPFNCENRFFRSLPPVCIWAPAPADLTADIADPGESILKPEIDFPF